MTCFRCGKPGHWRSNCTEVLAPQSAEVPVPVAAEAAPAVWRGNPVPPPRAASQIAADPGAHANRIRHELGWHRPCDCGHCGLYQTRFRQLVEGLPPTTECRLRQLAAAQIREGQHL